MADELFMTKQEFSMMIEQMAITKKLSYVDAVLKYCEENMLEPEDVKDMISRSLKDKMENDFREMRFLPKVAQLDV